MSKRTVNSGEGLAVALQLARQGHPVFPLVPGSKRPATPRGFKDATTDPDGIRALFGNGDFGVGVHTVNVFAVDLDVKGDADGVREFIRLNESHDAGPLYGAWPLHWLRFRTRSGGMHIIFKAPEGRPVRTGANCLGPGIDLRGPGGYIAVFDPADPFGYERLSLPGMSAVSPAPQWLLDDERLYGSVSAEHSEVTSLPDGPACDAVWYAGSPERVDFSDHHEVARKVLHLVRLAEEGHTGVMDVLVQWRTLYVEGRNYKSRLDGQPRDPESDFDRMTAGAFGKGTGATANEDPCARIRARKERFGF